MNKVSSARVNPSNMESIDNTKKTPTSEIESKQIFIKKGSTTIFQKFLAKLKGLKQAPTNAKLGLTVTAKAPGQTSNIRDKNIFRKVSIPLPPTDDVGPPPATDIDLDNILNELENLTLPPKDSQSELTKPTLSNNPKELGASAKDTNLKNLKDKFEAQPKKINFKPPSPTKDNPKLAKRAADTLELRYALKEMGLGDNGAIEKLKPRDKNNSGAVNNLNDSPTIIKQKHIANLEKAIDFGRIQFDKDKPNFEPLKQQKEFVEKTIQRIAHVSTLKKTEQISEGRGSLSNLKLELKREFQNLMIMADNNGYQPVNWIKKTADLDSALRSIDFIQEKKTSWF